MLDGKVRVVLRKKGVILSNSIPMKEFRKGNKTEGGWWMFEYEERNMGPSSLIDRNIRF